MEEKKYLEDLKNIRPLGLDKIQRTEFGGQKSEKLKQNIKQEIPNELKEIRIVEKLTNSKTLWGFGIAMFIYVVQNILIALNIAGPDNLIIKAVIETIIAVAGFFGVYGIRDALRKMSL